MEIQHLRFEPANRLKLAEHGISAEEVIEVVEGDRWAVDTRAAYPGQARVIGATHTGRMITIVMDPTDDPAIWRPVTGWNSTARERRYHSREMMRLP